MTNEELKLVNELWSLWESLAEAGEIQIGVGFFAKHDRLEKVVKNLNVKTETKPDEDICRWPHCGCLTRCISCTEKA